jgi:hypothetical protein
MRLIFLAKCATDADIPLFVTEGCVHLVVRDTFTEDESALSDVPKVHSDECNGWRIECALCGYGVVKGEPCGVCRNTDQKTTMKQHRCDC